MRCATARKLAGVSVSYAVVPFGPMGGSLMCMNVGPLVAASISVTSVLPRRHERLSPRSRFLHRLLWVCTFENHLLKGGQVELADLKVVLTGIRETRLQVVHLLDVGQD